jgi:hypothetical protein
MAPKKSTAETKTETKVEEKKVETKTEDKKVDPKPEDKKVDPKPEEKKADPKVDAKPEEKKAAPKKAAAKKAAPKKAAKKPAKKAAKKAAPKKAAPKKAANKKKADKKPKKDDKKQTAGDASSTDDPKARYFKLLGDNNVARGRFSGSKPKQAANKALTSILKSKGKQAPTGEIKFSIVECTRGSRHKTYNYVGQRVQLANPMKVNIGKGDAAKTIEYKFNNKVKKAKSA